ncbi:Mannan endo-1,6-alpha-mannosidase DCW1 [Lachnellula cervina]|uniref:mannan endo-1,6-alpha-mannosidase n=1 Tax=Lachnellula cervina TaxID=1316786 RepID=A0A7D8YQL0_9HELO|nr:Mannan endo-1,6-alpha-mannosidase DCW1 [Lachnellula cervina]
MFRACALLCLMVLQVARAIEIDVDNIDSIRKAASIAAYDMVSYYKGNESGQTPGKLPEPPYYWWESGAMWGALIDYWHYTGDTTYNDITIQGLQFQVGINKDFNPQNESAEMGNDDQAFWAMAALSAAETNFPNPPNPKDPSWLSLAQAVFNEQIGRWDTTTCGGGLRWQIYQINGYDLKNSISNGCLFNIASRLARYTNDDHYAQWAVKVWEWMESIGLIDQEYNVYDNSEATKLNCTQIDHNQWSYNAATMLMGASTMFNYTNGDPVWRTRTEGLIDAIALAYFPNGIMKDICEQYDKCNTDEHSFKAYLSRWMGQSTQMAPFIYDKSIALLKSSANAAAAQCTGGSSGTKCGLRWFLDGTWDGSDGVGQQMAALEVFQSTLVRYIGVPLTNSTGGTSISDPTAGHNSSAVPPAQRITPPTKGDKAGAWALTAFVALMAVWAWSSDRSLAGGFFLLKKSGGDGGKGKGGAVEIGASSNRWMGVVTSAQEEEWGLTRYGLQAERSLCEKE